MKKQLNNLLNILRKASVNKKLYVFLSCLILTIFFWILNALGNNYTSTIEFNVVYKNNPAQYIIISNLPQKLTLKINGLGFDILSSKLNLSSTPIIIDLSKIKIIKSENEELKKSKVNFDDYKSFLFSQIGNQLDVKEIYPKSVEILLDEKSQKLIKVEPLVEMDFEKQYQQDGEIKVKPAVVNVVGPKTILDTLNTIYTDKIVYKDVDETITESIGFDNEYKNARLTFNQEKVIVHIPVEKFTESSTIVKLAYINVPDSIELKAIPDEIEIKYMVPLSKLSNITSSKFNAFVDGSNIHYKYNKLKVKMDSYPLYLKSISIKPSKVEYILKKK